MDEIELAAEAISGSGSLALACHMLPDGDALGSMLALHHLCRAQGKLSVASWPEPFVVGPHYTYLPGLDLVTKPVDFPSAPEVMVTFDCGSLGRLGELAASAEAADRLVVVDHHATNDRYGSVNLVDPDAASSCELVYQLIRRMGGVPNTEEATALYTGIVTDTGRFQYSSTSPATLRVAADLRERGVDHTLVSNEIFESAPFGYLHTLGIVLSRARLEDGLVWSWLELKDLNGTRLDEAEDMINQLRSVREAGVAVLLKETEPGHYKVSMRSRGNVDVAQIAAAFGGGGHARAAGFPAPGGVEETIAAIRSALAPAGAGPPERAGA